MSIQREAFRRLKWPAVLVIAASSVGGLSLEVKASWFPQDAGIAPVESAAPTTPNTDQAAVVEQGDEGSGLSKSVDANAESAGVDADASGERIRLPKNIINPFGRPLHDPSREVKRRRLPCGCFLWGYPLFLAIYFERGRRADGKRPKMNLGLKMLSVCWLLYVVVLLITFADHGQDVPEAYLGVE